MAIIKSNVMGKFVGKVGTLSTYNNKTGNVARSRTNSTNVGEGASRTATQQSNRTKWANLVNTYKISRGWMPKAFENKATNQSDYNKFMSVNYALSTVRLTKEQAAAGACVIEPLYISQGSLPSVMIAESGEGFVTNIALSSLLITEKTTVAEFSAAVIANNKSIREGMQLSFVSYQQDLNALGLPSVICTAYEVVLDSNNSSLLFDFLPYFCAHSIQVDEAYMLGARKEDVSIGCFAWILSETIKGKTYVSTQQLYNNNAEMIDAFASQEQADVAMKSYGVTDPVFLDSLTAKATSATPQPQYITKVLAYDGSSVASIDPLDFIALLGPRSNTGNRITIGLASPAKNASACQLRGNGGSYAESNLVTLSSDGLSVSVPVDAFKGLLDEGAWTHDTARDISILVDNTRVYNIFGPEVHE